MEIRHPAALVWVAGMYFSTRGSPLECLKTVISHTINSSQDGLKIAHLLVAINCRECFLPDYTIYSCRQQNERKNSENVNTAVLTAVIPSNKQPVIA